MPFAVLKSKLYLPFLWTTKMPVFLFFGTWPLWGKVVKALLKAPKPKDAANPSNAESKKEVLQVVEEERKLKETSGTMDSGESAPATTAPVAQEDKKTL